MKIVITNHSMMYNRGSEAVMQSVIRICRFWRPDSTIVIVSGCEGEVLKEVGDADYAVPKFDGTGYYSYLLNESADADYVLITGADNYDYGKGNPEMKRIHDALFQTTSATMIAYDFSLHSSHMNREIQEDLNRFDILTVRESLTEQVFTEHFPRDKVRRYADPAFVLPLQKTPLPFGFDGASTIGINLSNLVMGQTVGISEDILLPNYIHLIDEILETTTYRVLLMQHVLNNGFDLDALQKVYRHYEENDHVIILQSEMLNAMQIKYIVSKLRFLVTARTHLSIAGYSTYVPTFVVGYSIKSDGIATDIFGSKDRYVLQVQSIETEMDLVNRFSWMMEHEEDVRKSLRERIPDIKKSALNFGELLL